MKSKRLLALLGSTILVIILAALLFPACAAEEAPTPAPTPTPAPAPAQVFEWALQSHWPASSSSYIPWKTFMEEELLELTDGRIKATCHPADTFLPTAELFDAWRQGTLDGGTYGGNYFESFIPLSNLVAYNPMAFREIWESEYFCQNLGFADALMNQHLEFGMYCWIEKVYPAGFCTVKPVRTLADLQGLKLRTSGKLADMMKKVGCAPVTMSGGEIYTALATGVLDAANWGAAQGVASMKFYEVAPYYMWPEQTKIGSDYIIITQANMDALPDDLYKIVSLALEERFWRRTNQYIKGELDSREALVKEYGMEIVELDKEAVDAMAKAALEIWDETAKQSPENAHWVEVMKALHRELGYID